MAAKKTKAKSADPAYERQYTIPLRLVVKLGSIAVHADEMLSTNGPHVNKDGSTFDRLAIESLLRDPEVMAWIQEMGPLLPRKR